MSKATLSIHPRNWPNGNGKKMNTSKPPKDATKGILGKRMRNLNDRRVALAGMKDIAGFKTPGSQSGKK